jgi:hypothetical protein
MDQEIQNVQEMFNTVPWVAKIKWEAIITSNAAHLFHRSIIFHHNPLTNRYIHPIFAQVLTIMLLW